MRALATLGLAGTYALHGYILHYLISLANAVATRYQSEQLSPTSIFMMTACAYTGIIGLMGQFKRMEDFFYMRAFTTQLLEKAQERHTE